MDKNISEEYPDVSRATARRYKMAKNDPGFDYEAEMSHAQKIAKAQKDVLEKHEAAVAKKLGKEGAQLKAPARHYGSYAKSLIAYPLTHVSVQFQFEEALIQIEDLANAILSDDPQALTFVAAFEDSERVWLEIGEVGEQGMLRLAKENGVDLVLDELTEDAPLKPEASKIWRLLEKDTTYRAALGAFVLSENNLDNAFLDWKKGFGWAKNSGKSRPQLPGGELLALLPNSRAERDLGRSLMVHPHWQLNRDNARYYCDGREGTVTEYQPDEVARDHDLAFGDAPQRALNTLDGRFKELRSEIVGDVIDILFHHWNTYKNPTNNAAIITAAKLCEYRGKVPEGDNLTLHWHALHDAFSINLRDTRSDLNAKVFFMESKGEIKDGPGARYAYSPGFMLQYALADNPLYFAPFLRKIWALDPKKHNETKRLARYLRGDWRLNTQLYLTSEGGARAARWHKWADILADCGIDAQAHKDSKDPKRLIEAVKKAVETLYDMEVIAEGGFDIYHPDDRKTAENLPRRGALTEWLSLRVCLAPSARLREALLETDARRRARGERDASAMATQRAKKQLNAAKNRKKS